MPQWFETYFDDTYLEMYSHLTDERTTREVAFITHALDLRPGAEVLDLCCGQGRHAVMLASQGLRVTGYDLSEVLLQRAQERAEAAGVEVRWQRGDMRRIPFMNEFDAVVHMFTAFGFFADPADEQAVLDGVARALKPGGRYLIDVANRDRVVADFRDQHWLEAGGRLYLSRGEFDPSTSRNRVVTTVLDLATGAREERFHDVRVYSLHEIEAMMGRAGLRVTGRWGGFDGQVFAPRTSNRIIVLAERTA